MTNAVKTFEDAQIVSAADAPMVAMIERIAMDPSVPIERLERMLEMKERMDQKAAQMAFATAFASMQASLPVIAERGAIKNKDGNVQSKYPLWEDVNAALRGPLSENGLSMSFDRRKDDGKTVIGCIITHVAGHSRRAEIDLPRDDSGSKNAVQGEGSTVSYGQRYSSKLILNWISEGSEDDDGKIAGRASRISTDQFVAIQNLIETAGADEAKFLAFIGATTLDDLTVKQFEKGVASLRTKIAQKGGAQ